MGQLDHSRAALRFFGEDLIPDHVSSLLGAAPTNAHVKGQDVVGSSGRVLRIAKTGAWLLEAKRREPEDLEAQIFELLDGLTADLGVWASLSRYKPDLFCGLFMASGNDGLPISSAALLALGQRGISLDLDIYDFEDEKQDGDAL